MNKRIKISAVSYLNTIPFIYGIEHSKELLEQIDLQKDVPSACADKLISGKVDLGLIPVAEIGKIKEAHIISNYCLGAVGKVDTVSLCSMVPIEEVDTILLDHQSRTSVMLTKLLVKNYFKISPRFISAKPGYENTVQKNTAALIIGDRVFDYQKKFDYLYDLSEIWMKYSSYPFVFALWTANKKLPPEFIKDFEAALSFGLKNMDKAIEQYKAKNKNSKIDLDHYLKKRINFGFDKEKKEGMSLFLEQIKQL